MKALYPVFCGNEYADTPNYFYADLDCYKDTVAEGVAILAAHPRLLNVLIDVGLPEDSQFFNTSDLDEEVDTYGIRISGVRVYGSYFYVVFYDKYSGEELWVASDQTEEITTEAE